MSNPAADAPLESSIGGNEDRLRHAFADRMKHRVVRSRHGTAVGGVRGPTAPWLVWCQPLGRASSSLSGSMGYAGTGALVAGSEAFEHVRFGLGHQRKTHRRKMQLGRFARQKRSQLANDLDFPRVTAWLVQKQSQTSDRLPILPFVGRRNGSVNLETARSDAKSELPEFIEGG